MAKIKLASILSAASGSFGGAVLSVKDGKEGTMRERVTPTNPKTAKQTNVRGAFGTSAKGFKGMPNVDALAWDAYGKTQRSKTGKPLSGIAAYNRLAIKYRLIHPGGTPPLTPPATPYLGDTVQFSAVAHPSAIVLQGTDDNAPGTVTEFLIQALPSANRKPQIGAYETVAYVAMDQSNQDSYSIPVAPGHYAVGYRFCSTVTGEQTDLVQLSVYGVTLQVVQGGTEEKPAARKKAA